MNINNIVVGGIISRISYQNKDRNIINFEVARNSKYMSKDGTIENETSFFSAIIDSNLLEKYKDIFKVGSKVVVFGIPNSYFDNKKRKCFCIRAFKLESLDSFLEKQENTGPNISFDTDGVMLWNGVRCEITKMDKDEEQELKDILSEY